MKVAICLPIHGGAEPRFVQSLARMIAFTMGARMQLGDKPVAIQFETFVYSTSNVAFARRKLADLALDWGASWTLWIDADQTFPPDTLLRLLARRQAIVGANCRKRDPARVLPTAFAERDGETVPLLPHGDGIEEIVHLGLAVCLVHAEVFRKIGQPYFVDEVSEDGTIMIGEDVNFCRKARAAGYRIFVDHALSKEVGHIAKTELKFPAEAETAAAAQ